MQPSIKVGRITATPHYTPLHILKNEDILATP